MIGENCVIKNSYIWDRNIILNDSKILHSLVAENCRISQTLEDCIVKKNITIENQSFLGVRLLSGGPNPKAYDSDSEEDGWDSDSSSDEDYSSSEEEDSLIASSEEEEEEDDDEDSDSDEGSDSDLDSQTKMSTFQKNLAVGELQKKIKNSTVLLSTNTNGVYCLDEPDVNSLQYQLEEANLSDDSIVSTSKKQKQKKKKERTMSSTSYYTEDGEDFDEESEEEEEEDFLTEGIATMDRALENNHDLDTALLELNTLRMSMNVSYHEVRIAICTSIFKRIYNFVKTQTLPAKEATIKVFNTWGPLLKRVTFDKEDFNDLFDTIENSIIDQPFDIDVASNIAFVSFNTLYNIDMIEEEHALLWWYKNLNDEGRNAEINKIVAKWIEWLEQDDEESSEEEEEE